MELVFATVGICQAAGFRALRPWALGGCTTLYILVWVLFHDFIPRCFMSIMPLQTIILCLHTLKDKQLHRPSYALEVHLKRTAESRSRDLIPFLLTTSSLTIRSLIHKTICWISSLLYLFSTCACFCYKPTRSAPFVLRSLHSQSPLFRSSPIEFFRQY